MKKLLLGFSSLLAIFVASCVLFISSPVSAETGKFEYTKDGRVRATSETIFNGAGIAPGPGLVQSNVKIPTNTYFIDSRRQGNYFSQQGDTFVDGVQKSNDPCPSYFILSKDYRTGLLNFQSHAPLSKNPSDCITRGTVDITFPNPELVNPSLIKPGDTNPGSTDPGSTTDPSKPPKPVTEIKPNGDSGKIGGSSTECNAESMTFILCPAIRIAAASVDDFKSILQRLLKVTPVTSNDSIYIIWKNIRNFANVVFVLVFLVVIFGSTLGLDSYTLKKTLPRLITAAILVQVSFWLAASVIDIGNILGGGMDALATGIGIAPPLFDFNNASSKAIGIGAILAVTALAAGAIFAISFTAVIAALIAILVVILALVARQIIIIVLIVTAPLAMVAWVLPNTEKMFKLWYKTLFQMVILYPIIMLLFIIGRLFALVANSMSFATGPQIGPVIAVIAYIVPLFLVPFAFKASGSLFNATSNGIAKIGTKANKQWGAGSTRDKNSIESKRLNNAKLLSTPLTGKLRHLNGIKNSYARKRGGFGGALDNIPGLGKIPGLGQTDAERLNEGKAVADYNKIDQDKFKRANMGKSADQLADIVSSTDTSNNERIATVAMMVSSGQFEELHNAQEKLASSNKTDSKGRQYADIYSSGGVAWQQLMSPHRQTIIGAGQSKSDPSRKYADILLNINNKSQQNSSGNAAPQHQPTPQGAVPTYIDPLHQEDVNIPDNDRFIS